MAKRYPTDEASNLPNRVIGTHARTQGSNGGYDAIVVGAGSVGGAAARHPARRGCRILALEQEWPCVSRRLPLRSGRFLEPSEEALEAAPTDVLVDHTSAAGSEGHVRQHSTSASPSSSARAASRPGSARRASTAARGWRHCGRQLFAHGSPPALLRGAGGAPPRKRELIDYASLGKPDAPEGNGNGEPDENAVKVDGRFVL
jgi:hypothetical protein